MKLEDKTELALACILASLAPHCRGFWHEQTGMNDCEMPPSGSAGVILRLITHKAATRDPLLAPHETAQAGKMTG